MNKPINSLRWKWKFLRRRMLWSVIAWLSPACRHKRRKMAEIHRELWGAHGYRYLAFLNRKAR